MSLSRKHILACLRVEKANRQVKDTEFLKRINLVGDKEGVTLHDVE